MEGNDFNIKDIFFVPYLEPSDVEEIGQALERGEHVEIVLSARHQTERIPGNITVCTVVALGTGAYLANGQVTLNFHRLEVMKGDAIATIVLNYPEYKFTIEESNNQFNEMILDSIS